MEKVNPGSRRRVAIYARVSTDGQTTENQLRELREAADRHGWLVVATHTDEGVSGAKGREKRPGFAAIHTAIAHREVDVVAALYWQAYRTVVMPGTGEPVFLGDAWRSRALTTHQRAVRACDHEQHNRVSAAGAEWQKIFGQLIPLSA